MADDLLSPLLAQVSLDTGVFYSGNICGMHDFAADERRGHLHLVRQGRVTLLGGKHQTLYIGEPTLLFLPRAWTHRLVATQAEGADVICATVQFGGGGRNPIAESLPDLIQIPLSTLTGARELIDLMMAESKQLGVGYKGILDRLCAVLIIRLLRHCMDHQLVHQGMLAGLADRRLVGALSALHASPQTAWDLQTLSRYAGMSRSRFAQRFHEVTGLTPADYLANWRVQVAQRMLMAGKSVKAVAVEVGYSSTSALSRVFARKAGAPPSKWLQRQHAAASGTSGYADETHEQSAQLHPS